MRSMSRPDVPPPHRSFLVGDRARLAALEESLLLDSPPEGAFDRITRIAARLLGAPIAIFSVIGLDRQYIKSAVGVPPAFSSGTSTPIGVSVFQPTLAGAPLVIADARDHDLIRDNPALSALNLVAYLSVPLQTAEDHVLGALCVIDHSPRQWSEEDVRALTDLTALLRTEIDLRRQSRSARMAEELKALNRELESRVAERTRELSRINQALLDSESRFRTLFEQSPLSIQLLSPEGKTTLINPAWKELWGFDDEFIQSFILTEYNILEDPLLETTGLLSYLRRGYAGEAVKIPEILYDPAANGYPGRPRWISALLYPLKDPSGRVRELVLIHNDVTDQKRAEHTLNFLAHTTAVLQSTLDPEQLIEALADAVVREFADGCIVDLIEGSEIKRLVTRHRVPETEGLLKELRRRYPLQADSPQPTPRVIRSGQPELLASVDVQQIKEHTLSDSHADLILRIGMRSHIAVPLRIRGETIGALNLLITTRRRHFDQRDVAASEELARRAAIAIDNARLYRNTRDALNQREEFISIASHELKTPITSLKLQTQLAMRRMERTAGGGLEAEYARSLLVTSNRQLDRLARLVEDMLDIARITTDKLSLVVLEVDLGELVREVVDRFKVQLAAMGVRIGYDAAPGVRAACDPMRIEQVVTNLITNAIRYGDGKPIEVTVKAEAPRALLCVRDFGVGIEEKDQARIFQRFERASSTNVSGLGLGLYISRDIVQAHGGTIRVESALGKGSTFTVELPLVGRG